MSVISNMLDGYIPTNILAKEFKIKSKDFRNTSLKSVTHGDIIFVQLPFSSIKFINSKEYIPAVLNEEERDESMYDYVLHISPKIRVGFWK